MLQNAHEVTAQTDLNTRVNATRVRTICGDVADITIWRWLNDPNSDFPKPVRHNGRRYWRLGDVLNWWESRPTT